MVLGKETYLDRFNINWTGIAKSTNSDLLERQIAGVIAPIKKVVISDSLTVDEIVPGNNTEVVKRKDVYKTITNLKQNSDRNIVILGSRILWQDLLAHDLIDELRLTIAPVFSGSGTPLFDQQPDVYLKRIDTRIAEGNIMVVFKVSRSKL